jgi:hypothetical protein
MKIPVLGKITTSLVSGLIVFVIESLYSRMESNSEENRIHCSEASARLLREQCPKIRIFPRGTIEVKGKGEMKTYWVHTEGSASSNNKNGAIRDGVKNVLKSLRGERAKKVSA